MEPHDRLERSGMRCDGCGRVWLSRVASLILGSPLARCAVCGGTLHAEHDEPAARPVERALTVAA